MSTLEEIDTEVDRHPWERQPEEPDRSWIGFKHYRDQDGVRSVVEAWRHYAEQEGLESEYPTDSFRALAENWRWTERARQYDNYLDRQRQAEKIQALRDAEEILVENAQYLIRNLVEMAAGPKDPSMAEYKAMSDALDRLGLAVPENPEQLHLHRHESDGSNEKNSQPNARAIIQYPENDRQRDSDETVHAELVDDSQDSEPE